MCVYVCVCVGCGCVGVGVWGVCVGVCVCVCVFSPKNDDHFEIAHKICSIWFGVQFPPPCLRFLE